VEKFPCQVAFTAFPIFVFILPDQLLHIVIDMCIHTHVCVGIVYELPLLPYASETFYKHQESCEVLTGYLLFGRRPGGDWATT